MSKQGSDTRADHKAMPVAAVPTKDDLEPTRRALGAWFAANLPEADGADVIAMRRPPVGGGSSDTFLIEVEVTRRGRPAIEPYVIRVKPGNFQLFMRGDFDAQYHLLRYLHEKTDVPVPAIVFYETDDSILGAPFWVMEKVEGLVPPDVPSYNAGGFLFEASPADRHKLWRSGIEALARIHRLDATSLPPIVALEPGESGLDENLRHWGESMLWATQNRPSPMMRKAFDWLQANRPARGATGLSWGDARIGNMIFRDFSCAAVIDWETITLAGPQLDLAHWLTMDLAWGEDVGIARLPGLGGREDTIRLWEDLTGLRADQLTWHEVLAAFRLAIIGYRFAALWAAASAASIPDPLTHEDVFSDRLRKVMAAVSPGSRTPG